MANSVIKQLLTNQILAYLPDELVREVKSFAFNDMQSHTSKCNKDVVNHLINNAWISSYKDDKEEAEAEPYFGDVWDDPENDPWANDDDANDDEYKWAFCENEECNQFQCVFCTNCGDYRDGFMHNQNLLIDKGIPDIPYPNQILCKCYM